MGLFAITLCTKSAATMSSLNAMALNSQVVLTFGAVNEKVKLPSVSVVSMGRKNANGDSFSRKAMFGKSALSVVLPKACVGFVS